VELLCSSTSKHRQSIAWSNSCRWVYQVLGHDASLHPFCVIVEPDCAALEEGEIFQLGVGRGLAAPDQSSARAAIRSQRSEVASKFKHLFPPKSQASVVIRPRIPKPTQQLQALGACNQCNSKQQERYPPYSQPTFHSFQVQNASDHSLLAPQHASSCSRVDTLSPGHHNTASKTPKHLFWGRA